MWVRAATLKVDLQRLTSCEASEAVGGHAEAWMAGAWRCVVVVVVVVCPAAADVGDRPRCAVGRLRRCRNGGEGLDWGCDAYQGGESVGSFAGEG